MFNTQLTKVYFDETLKEAAQSRSDRKAQNGNIFLQIVIAAMLWLSH